MKNSAAIGSPTRLYHSAVVSSFVASDSIIRLISACADSLCLRRPSGDELLEFSLGFPKADDVELRSLECRYVRVDESSASLVDEGGLRILLDEDGVHVGRQLHATLTEVHVRQFDTGLFGELASRCPLLDANEELLRFIAGITDAQAEDLPSGPVGEKRGDLQLPRQCEGEGRRGGGSVE